MNISNPLFSIIVPLYNKQEHVKETIESALGQTFEEFEVLVINDGSTDKSVEIIEAINDERIRLIHQENAGVSAARNRGIQEARAEYVAFLDADDLWMPGFLQTVHELITKYPESGIYATAYHVHAAGKVRLLNTKSLPSKDFEGILPNYFKLIANGELLVWTSAVCVPKKVFLDNDIWFPVGEPRGEDQFVWARIALQFDIAYSYKVQAQYNLHTSNSTTGTECNFYEPRDFLFSLKEFKNIKGNHDKSFWLDRFLEKEVFNVIKRNVFNRRRALAMRQLFFYDLSFSLRLKILAYLVVPRFVYKYISVSVRNSIRYKRRK